jgi:hypothetical protein
MRITAITAFFLILASSVFGSGTTENQTLAFGGIRDVTVTAQFLDVEVTGADTLRVDMSSTADNSYRVRHEQVGGSMRVWIEKDWPFGFDGGGLLRFRVPRSVSLRVETISGRIVASGLSGGSCTLKTVSGRIVVEDLRADIRTESVSGEILLQGTRGTISANTISGSITGDEVALLGDSTFGSVSGKVDIHPATPLEALRFDLSSLSGRIVVGTIGTAKGLRMGFTGPLIKAQTISGPVLFR